MIHDNVVLGQMTCPNCGIERGTDLSSCVCGYNPMTNKVEPLPLVEVINIQKDIRRPSLPVMPIPTEKLDLCELLKDCHFGEEFYSLLDGEVRFIGINEDKDQKPIMCAEGFFCADGRYQNKPGAKCCLWPSEKLYLKYPLDPYQAWEEWKKLKERKYILEIETSSWFDGLDGREDIKYDGKEWFKFKSKAKLEEVIKDIKECLRRHKDSEATCG